MVTITTDTKISLEHSKFLWIILAIFRSPAKLVRKKTPGTTTVLIGYIGNLMVGGTTDMKTSLQQTARCTEIASVVQTLFDQQLNSVKSTVENHHRVGSGGEFGNHYCRHVCAELSSVVPTLFDQQSKSVKGHVL